MKHTRQTEQAGTVLVFKPGVTQEQAEKRLKALSDILDGDYYVGSKPRVETFNPEWGGPVWYIP